MDVRQRLQKSPALMWGVLAAICVAIVISFWSLFYSAGEVTKVWFTVDDGKTYFADDIGKVPPFQKDGKTAYGCDVFTCDDGKTKFVGYLFRYREKAASEFAALGPPPSGGQALQEYLDRRSAIEIRTREVKKPLTGDTGWALARASSEGAAITTVRCPTPGGALQSVFP